MISNEINYLRMLDKEEYTNNQEMGSLVNTVNPPEVSLFRSQLNIFSIETSASIIYCTFTRTHKQLGDIGVFKEYLC